MEKGEGEVGLLVKDDDDLGMVSSSRDTCQCRICHEEEPQSSTIMESPCACSGSLKFAHRSCVQRWCDEKGSTVCEICLQNFESGYSYNYTVPPKKAEPVDVAVTIRGSLDVPRQNYEAIGVTNLEHVECSPAPSRGASCCRSLVITLATLLLLRHFMDVILIGDDQYASSLLIMFSLRATGILLPLYFVLRLICAIQHGQRQYKLEQIQLRREEEIERFTSDEENPSHYTIQIFS